MVAWRNIQAEIWLLPASAGGRTPPIYPGYRGIVCLNGVDAYVDCELKFDVERLEAGEHRVVCISMWAGDMLPDLSVGQPLDIREGPRVVARGSILDPGGCTTIPAESP